MGKMAGRPMLQDLVKAAVAESAARVSVTEEARLQNEKTGEKEKCGKCGKEKCACGGKMASASPSDEHVTKLASALDYLAGEFIKVGANLAGGYGLTEHLQTAAPGVLEARASTPLPDKKGEGVHTVPMHPGEQKAMKPEHGATQMENTQDHAPQLHKEMPPNVVSGKHAGVGILTLIRTKLAGADAEKKETKGLEEAKKGLDTAEKAHKSEPENKEGSAAPKDLVSYLTGLVKKAEDAINPAQISAGAAVPPDTSAAGQPGGEPAGGAPNGPTGLVGSADAAIKYTKGEVYAGRKTELGKYFDEPALKAEHDRVLQVAFENTGKAGPKIASAEPGKTSPSAQAPAQSVKTAAARVLLQQLADSVDSKQQTA